MNTICFDLLIRSHARCRTHPGCRPSPPPLIWPFFFFLILWTTTTRSEQTWHLLQGTLTQTVTAVFRIDFFSLILRWFGDQCKNLLDLNNRTDGNENKFLHWFESSEIRRISVMELTVLTSTMNLPESWYDPLVQPAYFVCWTCNIKEQPVKEYVSDNTLETVQTFHWASCWNYHSETELYSKKLYFNCNSE